MAIHLQSKYLEEWLFPLKDKQSLAQNETALYCFFKH